MNFRVGMVGALLALLTSIAPAQAAPNLADIQIKIRALQVDAANAAEGAQQAQVEFNNLNKTLASVQQRAAQQSASLDSLKKSLGSIAAQEYKNGGLSQGMELIFSSNPTLFLSAAGSLETITKRKSIELRSYTLARQRLNATSLTVNDKISLARAAQSRYIAQRKAANAKLAEAEKLLTRLTKAERVRLLALQTSDNDKFQSRSLKLAAKTKLGSGRGAIALRFALKQIGDKYVFGAAGMDYWDCSGLTMRAYQQAGVSLPHSAAAQFGYGKPISRADLQPGDLVFFSSGGYIGHNGIYLGGGYMVDAPHSGARVRVEPFSAAFGGERFAGGRRL